MLSKSFVDFIIYIIFPVGTLHYVAEKGGLYVVYVVQAPLLIDFPLNSHFILISLFFQWAPCTTWRRRVACT